MAERNQQSLVAHSLEAEAENLIVHSKFKSRIFQPEIVSINSADRIETSLDESQIGYYSSFRVVLKTPILNVKSLQLLRATIPNICTTIPDTETVFWYYRLPQQTPYQEPVPPDPQYLHCVRILPSYYPTDLMPSGGTFAINRIYNTYQDLLVDLNVAAEQTDNSNPYYIPRDIEFGYDNKLNKFSFSPRVVGNDLSGNDLSGNQHFYSYAGYDDPNVIAAQKILNAATVNAFGIQGLAGQPYVAGRTLNLRLGFVWSGVTLSQTAYKNHIRPVPDYAVGALSLAHPSLTYTAESYCDLVYSHNCHIFCNLTSGSAYGNKGEPNLLMSVPIDTAPLGVSYYIASLEMSLTKVPQEIYEIQIIFRTDSGLPFYLPNSANAILDIGFSFSP